jgi:signal transduction protein with GAF and PtsI domain
MVDAMTEETTYPAGWERWSSAERQAWQEGIAIGKRVSALYDELLSYVPEASRQDAAAVVSDLDYATTEAASAQVDQFAARLRRLLPSQVEVIDLVHEDIC